jgi:osmoprotectant transport system permease protein
VGGPALAEGGAPNPWFSWSYVTDNGSTILRYLGEHVRLTVLAVLIGAVIALPLALIARHFRFTAAPLLGLSTIIYTIPSLALFALLVPAYGLSRTTAEIGLVGYTLLILVRNVVAGLDGVPADVVEAARGMGMSRWGTLLRVELPLALPAIVAGVRIATVTTIGLVTVTAVIGQGGLGQLILDGFTRDFRTPLTVGLTLSVALAALTDLALLTLERVATPWARDPR